VPWATQNQLISLTVIPAQAGIQQPCVGLLRGLIQNVFCSAWITGRIRYWIPACSGMTGEKRMF